MACCPTGAKPLSEPMLINCLLDPWKFNLLFFHENAFENVVYKMAAIMSQPQQSGTKPNLVAKILATNFGVFFVI